MDTHHSQEECKPLVSIILPTYNRAHLLERAINSVLKQEYENWELIIIDDGSTDNTKDVLLAFKDARIKVFGQRNMGISSSRNAGIDKATGDWFCFLSSDDELVGHALSKMMNIPLSFDNTINSIYCNATDVSTSSPAGRGLSPGYLDTKTMPTGENWFIFQRSMVGQNRFVPGLNGFEGELHLRLLPKMKRFFIEDFLYLYHTEESDRISKRPGENPTMSPYAQWARFYDARPNYLVDRYAAGMGNIFDQIVLLFIQNKDWRRAKRLYNLGVKNNLLERGFYRKERRLSEPEGRFQYKKGIVKILRKIGLKPPAPHGENN